MPPTPILPYAVNLILQYISPPSQLDTPLPPHLLSRSLLQRHIFLEIPPENSASYLSWASANRDRAIALLESLPKPLDDHKSSLFPVQYTCDGETTSAHVHINVSGEDGLRLVFQWDGQDSWKYHDANLMPFPPDSHPSLSDALASADFEDAPHHVVERVPESGEPSDDDDYWNSYGGADDDGSPHLTRHMSKDGSETGEDAYWAQYSSVHGTADSTIPSPVQKTRRKLHPTTETHHIATEEILPIPPSDFHYRSHTVKQPPSPYTLTRRLAALSPRHSRPPSTPGSQPDVTTFGRLDEFSAAGEGLGEEEDEPITESAEDEDSDTPSPPTDLAAEAADSIAPLNTAEGHAEERIVSPRPVKVNGISFLHEEGEGGAEVDVGLGDAIRGVYRLWHVARRMNGRRDEGSDETDEFLRVVREAIDRL
ncbi:hypothetical protein BV25DRAFT_1819099 [Artomyces pyxidatus]|uniref:Uncharacterized protein n=1 Tax=Artomyces pyxidatus TaxID=48021 RepID=A0ACB8TH00_9AGAM|nr:hypothetical protein BV25DRAFT_1819099 [Artomyces pyxidatus]